MRTKILGLSKLKQVVLELFVNKTNKVSDVSDNSVTNAIAYGVAKVGQKAIKDIAVVESQIMPDSASGSDLDNAGKLFSSITRKTALQSSTYLRIVAEEGTFYDKTVVSFSNYNGVQFIPEEDLTISSQGYGYLKVRSVDSGLKTNVDPNSIVTINSEPTGHISVINEYIPQGGIDDESDELFRQRIKKHTNIVSRYTEEYYAQIFQEYNENILKVITLGVDDDGKKSLGVVTENGISLSESELDDLLENTKQYFPIQDINKFGDLIGIKLVNVGWYYVGDPAGDDSGTGIDFRVQLWDGYDADQVRIDIQVNIAKYLDFRYWKRGDKVEWDDLLEIVKRTDGVRYVPDGNFKPNSDEQVPVIKLPRVRKFIMRDLDGNIISDSQGVLSPVFYPNELNND